MRGKIIKGIAGFYYVHVIGNGMYECKAKGIFRNKNLKPLVGDNVEIAIIDAENKKGNIEEVLQRSNELVRPAVANVNQALIVFALASPRPNLNLLDRFLVMMEYQNVDTIICFNKQDLIDDELLTDITSAYTQAGYHIIITSVINDYEIDKVKKVLEHKTTVLAGPSGVGKSSMLNKLIPEAHMDIGDISIKIGRGKHTTRHSEIFHLEEDAYIVDTPGFSSLFIENLEPNDLRYYFSEFRQYEGKCKYNGCVHVKEPGCKVKEALGKNMIHSRRYDNYISFYEELVKKKKY